MNINELFLQLYSAEGFDEYQHIAAKIFSDTLDAIIPESSPQQRQQIGAIINIAFQLGRSEVEAERLNALFSYSPSRRRWPAKEG